MTVLVIDQIIKVNVKTGMYLGERIEITSWFSLLFVENNGMAFGWELWGGKLFLTLFRIVAIIAIGWFIIKEIKTINQ
jgi:signal peptidase II